ncbi:MAG: response regulator transcription factor [Erysipelotrichaceae bacterium]|nr:response regulator transcription factor [Erysipelotrichaceae bacterium]
MSKVCFVDDEQNIRRLVAYDLKQAGYDFTLCENGQEAYLKSKTEAFDVYIIDWMMPEMEGISLVKKLRSENNGSIMIMLTAKSEEEDLIDAFEAGVDDYLTKPFSSRELLVRIKAHLSRVQTKPTSTLVYKDLHINLMNRSVTHSDKPIELTKTEFDLLIYFTQNPSTVLSRDQILTKIWGFEYDGDTRIVDVHVFKLRSKLENTPLEIKSVRGIGYLLEISV